MARNIELAKGSWDMPSIIDRLETLTDMYNANYEIDKALLAEELESMALWLRE